MKQLITDLLTAAISFTRSTANRRTRVRSSSGKPQRIGPPKLTGARLARVKRSCNFGRYPLDRVAALEQGRYTREGIAAIFSVEPAALGLDTTHAQV